MRPYIATLCFVLIMEAVECRVFSPCRQARPRTFTMTLSIPPTSARGCGPLRPPPQSVRKISPETAKQIKTGFPGLFFNETEMKKGEIGRPLPPPGRPLPGTIDTDGDLHCPTVRNTVKVPDTLQSTSKQMREVVHLHEEKTYQFYHTGTCQSLSGCSGGRCLQETSIVYLMVWDDSSVWPFTFDSFEVETYCSCKNIG